MPLGIAGVVPGDGAAHALEQRHHERAVAVMDHRRAFTTDLVAGGHHADARALEDLDLALPGHRHRGEHHRAQALPPRRDHVARVTVLAAPGDVAARGERGGLGDADEVLAAVGDLDRDHGHSREGRPLRS